MNSLYRSLVFVVLSFGIFNTLASAQAFRKGSVLVSLSEGSTWSSYTSINGNGTSDVIHTEHINGDRDPICVEYGLSKHWGIGLNVGTDIFKVDPAKFYGFETGTHNVKALMSEFTVEGSYHFFVTKKLDVAAFGGLGLSSVFFKGNDGDYAYKYNAGGIMVRAGVKARYYFFRRLGAIGMLSVFSTNCSTNDVTGNTAGQGYSTAIKGAALEFGLCYRIRR